MGVYGGLQGEDAKRWGQFTTLKTNAAELAARALRPGQVIYCSPLVDPYQPAEREHPLMPGILEAVLHHPPDVFVIQTRGTLVLRDIRLLEEIARVTNLRIGFSITTDREDIRRRYEPHCESIDDRLAAMRRLRSAGLEVYAVLAPLLPCDPKRLAQIAAEASGKSLIGDPLHIRATKPRGATTRTAAFEIARRHGDLEWFEAEFQERVLASIREAAATCGVGFAAGPDGFSWLAAERFGYFSRCSSMILALTFAAST